MADLRKDHLPPKKVYLPQFWLHYLVEASRKKQNHKVEIDNNKIAIEVGKVIEIKEVSKREAINSEMNAGMTATTRINKVINNVVNKIKIKPMTLHRSPETAMNGSEIRMTATIIGMKDKTGPATRHCVAHQINAPKIQTSEDADPDQSLKPNPMETRVLKMKLLLTRQ